ncbi:carboxylate-amine ligase [Paractinoplanes maris]|uniref:carboxylate-amine ligase n=1 Tax=Paractinoplanes maris TaxID=1734446 RepID=UPI002020FCCE|nr:glutamate--cysteine ligase [Actinoplanes maris]
MVTSYPVAATGRDTTDQHHLTLGVEEEFLLLDPDTGRNAPVADDVIAVLPSVVRRQSRLELRRSMVEMVTSVCTDLGQLREQLIRHRRMAGAAAATTGARLVAVGATPVDEPQCDVPDQPRYRDIVRRYGPVALDPALCGCHVHVGVPDRDLAVRVCDRLRVWLPVVQALTANSPFSAGTDTGHASWRSVQLTRWPGVGPTPSFASADDYDATVAALVTTGVMIDDAMVYWYARPSATYPTVEVRVGDVCPTADDTVLVAALIRALVATMIDDERAGAPVESVRDCVLSAAHWRAAHEGLDGTLVDLRLGGVLRPAWEMVDELVATVSPALLRHGDIELVVAQLARLRAQGTGAARQRRIHARTQDINAVLADLARQTIEQ